MVEAIKETEIKEVKILEKPWVEKYRPKVLDDIVGQDHIVRRLKHYVRTGTMPHLLFAGPPGVGKTTAALCLARELFGEHWGHNFLELNASVSKNTPILVRLNGKVMRTTFAELDRIYFGEGDGDVAYRDASNLEVLTVDENYNVRWANVSKIIRHKVEKILRVHLEGGGVLELTGNHSIMLLDENGLVAKKASEIRIGDYFLSFVTNMHGFLNRLNMDGCQLESAAAGIDLFNEPDLNEDSAWAFGFRENMPGQTIYTLGTHETALCENRILNTPPAEPVGESIYDGSGERTGNKRMPSIYEVPVQDRIAYLKGLADGKGEWDNVTRISSVSKDLLVDIAWLARLSGIESSIFEREVRLIWKDGTKWKRSDLLPANVITALLKRLEDGINGNWRHELRHQLHDERERISKETIKKILGIIDVARLREGERKTVQTLRKLAYTDLHALKVTKIEIIEYNDFVYDVSVPNNEMFFAGNIPVLLHNSDERGINVIREKVKEFARTKPIGAASFKIIFLDEADALTQDAQQALRRTMEMFSNNVRFILSCNYSSKIIEPIQSRCAMFRFRPLKDEDVAKRLRYIAEQEGLGLTGEGLQALLYVAEGDLRRAINVLQAAAALDMVITDENVFTVASRARPEDVREMMILALEGNFLKARDRLREILLKQGLSGEDVLIQMHKEVFNLPISEPKKVALADKIGEYNFRLVEGANEMIQLEALLAQFTLLGK